MIALECQNCQNSDKDCCKEDTEIEVDWICSNKQPIIDEDEQVEEEIVRPDPEAPKIQSTPPTGKREDLMRANFRRLSAKRLARVLESIRVLGHLTNKAAYIWDEDDVDGMLNVIQASLDRLRRKFGE
jgi:hypothetical protein